MAPYEETLYIALLLGAGAFVAWLIARFASERARERERRNRVVEAQIEKFGDTREFIEFARSGVGQAWLRADSGELRVRRGLLVLIAVGIFFLALGAAYLVKTASLAGAVSPDETVARAGAAWWGTVLAALGLGSLAAAALIARVARAWNLIPPARSGRRETDGE